MLYFEYNPLACLHLQLGTYWSLGKVQNAKCKMHFQGALQWSIYIGR